MATYQITNPPQLSNLNDFRSALARGEDLAQSAQFAVQIGKISNLFSDLIYMCESAEMPGRAFAVNEYRYYGPGFKMPHQTEYTEINFSFYVSNLMHEKEIFDNWMGYINPKNSYNFRFRNEYSTDIYIYQFSQVAEADTNRNVATYKSTLRQAYPINVQAMPLSWAEDNIHRLQVTFAYTDWVTEPESKENSDRASQISPFKPR